MDDEATEIKPTLTSTMGNVLLSQNNDKNDANDSTPTSSTDAASTCSKTPLNATDDPISSTSSDLLDKNKVGVDIKRIKKDTEMAKSQAMSDNDVDLLDMSIGNVSSEPITEEMEDIVQDLQKILGEADTIDDLPSKRKTIHDTSTDEKFLSALDDLGDGDRLNTEVSQEDSSENQVEISRDALDKELEVPEDTPDKKVEVSQETQDKQVKVSEKTPDEQVEFSQEVLESESSEKTVDLPEEVPGEDLEISQDVLAKQVEISEEDVEKEDEIDTSMEKLEVVSKLSENSPKDECLRKQEEVEIQEENIQEELKPQQVECDKEICVPQAETMKLTETESKKVENEDLSSQLETCSEDAAINEVINVSSGVVRVDKPDKEKPEEETHSDEDKKEEAVRTNESASCDEDENSAVPLTSTGNKHCPPVKIELENKENTISEEVVEPSTSESNVDTEMCTEKTEIIAVEEAKVTTNELVDLHDNPETVMDIEKEADTIPVCEKGPEGLNQGIGEKGQTIVDQELISVEPEAPQIAKESAESDRNQESSSIIEIVENTALSVSPQEITEGSKDDEVTERESGALKTSVIEEHTVTESVIVHDTTASAFVSVADVAAESDADIKTTTPLTEELTQRLEDGSAQMSADPMGVTEEKEKSDVDMLKMEETTKDLIGEHISEISSPITEKLPTDIESKGMEETNENLVENVSSDVISPIVEISTKPQAMTQTNEEITMVEEEEAKSVDPKESIVQESAVVNEMEDITPEVDPEDTTAVSPCTNESIEQVMNAQIEENEQVVPELPQHEVTDLSEKELLEQKASIDNETIVKELTLGEICSEHVEEDSSTIPELVSESTCEELKTLDGENQEILSEETAEPISEEPVERSTEKVCQPSVGEQNETSQVLSKESVELQTEDVKEENSSGGVKVLEQDSESAVLSSISASETKDQKSAEVEDLASISCQEQNSLHTMTDLEKTSDVIKSDSSKDQNIENSLASSDKSELVMQMSDKPAEELIPVIEEVIVKKTIIYEHDCHLHKEKNEQQSAGETIEKDEVNTESNLNVECVKMVDSQNSQIEDMAIPRETMNIDCAAEKAIDVSEKLLNEAEIHTDEISADPLPKSEAVSKAELSTTSQHSVPPKDLIVNEVDEAVKHIVLEDKIHDQTTAAVQSILDNMLAEEQNIVEISEKDEAPVVHSSYSSYELAKAVQQIQDFSPVDNTEEISEGLSFVSGAEKQVEPIENENIINNIQEVKECIEQEIVQAAQNDSTIEMSEPQPHSNLEQVKQQEIEACSIEATETIEKQTETVRQSNIPVQKQPELPIVRPSIDLSEESSSEESLEEDNTQSKISSTTSAELNDPQNIQKDVEVIKISSENVLKGDTKKASLKEARQSTRVSERSKDKTLNTKGSINEPLSINIEETEKEKSYSPRITIKPIREEEPAEEREEHKGSLKITITKQSDNTHSILKICSPDMEQRQRVLESEEQIVPKLVIKTADVEQHSPKMSTRSSKQSISANSNQRSGSPRITIKPIPKPETKEPVGSPLKITIKPLGKPEEFSKHQQQRHSPKLPRCKLDDDHYGTRSKVQKTSEISEVHSPKVTIKPVLKPLDEIETTSTPKITIKPIEKPDSEAKTSPKITIKPVVKPAEIENEPVEKRIVLKINKGTIPTKDNEKVSRKREHDEDKSEKLAKIKLKFSKGGDAHIVHEATPNKRGHDADPDKCKRLKGGENPNSDEDVKIIEDRQSPIVISEDSRSQDSVILVEEMKDPPSSANTMASQESRIAAAAPMIQVPQQTPGPKKRGRPRKVPLVIRDDFANMQPMEIQHPVPVPIVEQQAPETESTGRPKRSCRGQSVRDTLGIKPRKPKAPPKVRGGKRGGARGITKKSQKELAFSEEKIDFIKQSLTEEAVQIAQVPSGLSKLPKKNQGLSGEQVGPPFELKGLLLAAKDQNIIEVIEIDTPSNSPKSVDAAGNLPTEEPELSAVDITASDVEMQPPTPVIVPHLNESAAMDIGHSSDIAIFEEETRMSADVNSRAQTPAKQVVSDVVVEESQSSMQSTATTESGKINRKSRLEVHQEPDTAIVTADQLNEYYWGGNGPYMIQEQVAQFLGIKSFKRKYPSLPRRMVDMQERDYIRENGLASESMCDLGLTAVNSADILDIMYSDFQDKYEEYCKYQRDKQAKDLINKQKALSLATGQEKNKLDIMEQAIQSAAAYNANFNKVRKEQRRACMDLQTMNVHYPKGKIKPVVMPKIGFYPVAVVPGQYTDCYKEFTPTELNNLPLNTMLYKELHKVLPEGSDSESDSSGSDSDESSSSDSDSDSSCDDGCKMCTTTEKKVGTPRKSPIHAGI